ncbi:MAG: hypothetical protein PW788_02000 [Micavibrio sp.]|nr:hypothetical protein [Micavibrio sp.]
MTTVNGLSFLNSSQTQTGRLKDLASTLNDLERQMSTSKKYDTLAGLGTDSLSVQRLRMDKNTLDTYSTNIDNATSRINLMSQTMTSASGLASQLVSAINSSVLGGNTDISEITTLAKQGMAFLGDMMNTQLDGRYLFAGSDTTAQPYSDSNTANANMQAQITAWLNGTQTTAQLTANVNAFSASDVGINPALSGSGSVSVRVDTSTEVDYTVKADNSGMQDIMKALALAANLTAPGAGDTPDATQMNNVLRQIATIAQGGADALNAQNAQIGSKFDLMSSIQDTHKRDAATYETLFSSSENADTTEVVAKVQQLQTQLEASYQVTSIASKLSLVNFIS